MADVTSGFVDTSGVEGPRQSPSAPQGNEAGEGNATHTKSDQADWGLWPREDSRPFSPPRSVGRLSPMVTSTQLRILAALWPSEFQFGFTGVNLVTHYCWIKRNFEGKPRSPEGARFLIFPVKAPFQSFRAASRGRPVVTHPRVILCLPALIKAYLSNSAFQKLFLSLWGRGGNLLFL